LYIILAYECNSVEVKYRNSVEVKYLSNFIGFKNSHLPSHQYMSVLVFSKTCPAFVSPYTYATQISVFIT